MSNNNLTVNTQKLEVRSIGSLTGCFRIPSYQRGYRWERRQVIELLDDIANSDDSMPYYLQPIVVAPAAGNDESDIKADYDLIDGQQRLTTIYLILTYLDTSKDFQPNAIDPSAFSGPDNLKELQMIFGLQSNLNGVDTTPNFSFLYQTRKDSYAFLKDIATLSNNDSRIQMSPDHLYMWHALQVIKEWVRQNMDKVTKLAKSIKERVNIIWYELPDTVENWKKFTELNIGKIPLTNSELIKALFLSNENQDIQEYEKEIIVAQWDQVERELADKNFWGFLTKELQKDYPTKIDLLFNLIERKKEQNKNDDFYTFRQFSEKFKNDKNLKGKEKWEKIYLQYQQLRDWYNDRHLFHRIGYLVSVNYPENTLQELFDIAFPVNSNNNEGSNATKSRIRNVVEQYIKQSIKLPTGVDTFRAVSYKESGHAVFIHRLLTLYNVLLTDNVKDHNIRYSFYDHNNVAGGWSLEHIHAQNSDSINNVEGWSAWVESHLDSVSNLEAEIKLIAQTDEEKQEYLSKTQELKNSMSGYLKQNKHDRTKNQYEKIFNDFSSLADDVLKKIQQPDTHSEQDKSSQYKDEISNLTLLGRNDNSRLSNSTFDVKRNVIMSELGIRFVPIGTQRVFLKTIHEADTQHLYFWCHKDRKAYINDIERVLAYYLPKPDMTDTEQESTPQSENIDN